MQVLVLFLLTVAYSSPPWPEGHHQVLSLDCIHKHSAIRESDEDSFGSCDFERDSCSWNDTSDSDIRWTRVMANVSTVPGVDHTTGSAFGQFMYVEGERPGFFSEALLERTLLKASALGCQICFWYHLHGSSSDFALRVVTNSSTTDLWDIRTSQTKGWENATVDIGNRPEGTKLVFSMKPSFHEKQDVMLDDITFPYCSGGAIPPGSDWLSCDFETGACGWYPDHSASMTWKRVKEPSNFNPGPEFDHTTGEGYYIFIGTDRTTDPSMTARMMSYPQQAKCISFWYHIYGSSIGTLKFKAKEAEGDETDIWMRTGTHGNKWRFVDLTLPAGGPPVQFIFEAVLGGTHGSIAIDDVVVSSGVDGACPPERECTFQASLCGLQPDPTADFSWVRARGGHASGVPGPAADHTLGTAQGYYLSGNLWEHPKGSRGHMVTTVNAPTPQSGECWMFWYHMGGQGVGELSVRLRPEQRSTSSFPLWTISGDQGDLWRHGRATVLSPDSPYQVVFEAVVGDGPGRNIAIDDLLILNGPCPPEGFCDFEMDMCDWLNRPYGPTAVAWDWTSASGQGKFVPDVDHTTNSALGHYMVFDAYSGEQTAHFISVHMAPVSKCCLEFWYHMEMWFENDLVQLSVYINESGTLDLLWSQNGNQKDVWHKMMLDYTSQNRHQIIFEASCPHNVDGVIALDDIFVRRDVACSDLLPTTPAPTTQPTSPPVSAMSCSFEDGFCDWVQDSGSAWSRQNGIHVKGPWLGPLYDHTAENNQGFYLLVNKSGEEKAEPAVISVAVATQADDICVGFWYYMLGASASSLDVLVQSKNSQDVVWTRGGSQESEWLSAQVTISTADKERVLFSGGRNGTGSGFIAIDDIAIREGPCVDFDPCGFESTSLCGFEQDVTDDGDWTHLSGHEWPDHTYGTRLGHSMAALATDLQWSGSIQLLTPEMDSTVALCISFWHKLSIGAKDSLSVHILREGELGPVLWILTGASPSDWEVSEVTVSSPSKFRVAFKATLNQAPDSHVLLDDVAVTDGACTPTGSCDFESGQCTWNSAGRATAKTHEWIQADGHFQGPETDHTTQTSDGRFLLSRTQNPNSKAVLVSERFQQISQLCFSFWIYINDSDSGTFRVFTRSATDSQDLLLETRFTEKKWIRFSNTLSVAEHIQIFLEAESESSGFIAIDDILITPNICQDHVNVSALTACQFEDGTCGWRDVSVGQFSWRRDRNGTDSANTGPSVDHTTGTELGWYMAVEADHGEHNSYAALQSPAFDQASVDCGFEFYYHMFGEGIGGLTVLLQEGSRLTPLLSISGDHGDEWRRAELGMGHTHQVFSLVLEGTRTFSELGDIAVDDVSFFNCTLPETLDPCPTGFFSCSNHVCVEAGRVCDFSNDCGDMSDETRCESLGYLDRCSFERGLCWWESGHSDAQGPRWTRQKGQTTLPNLGPPRDHTRNSAAGYFLMPGQPLTPGEWTEILSRTLLPSSGCTVRFYHYSHNGGSEVRLSVKLRTERSGSSDYQLWSGSHLPVFRWQRAEITFSTAVVSKIVFRYTEAEEGAEGHSALDDVSFSTQCHHDPENSQLPLMPTTPPSTGATPTFTPTSQPCTGGEFFCWRSDGVECVPVTAQCDYRVDCPLGEDEETCGPCSFELGQCQWSDISIGAPKWQRQKSNDQTDPPQDHTTGTGYYMWVNASGDQQEHPALLQSPTLPPTSPYCQLLFHFHMARVGPGSVSVSLQSAGGQRDQLWSRTRDSAPMWSQEHLPLGEQPQSYTIIFSSDLMESQATPTVALDDVTFVNCETSYQPPDLPLLGCSFEEDLCGWTLDASGDLDWQRESGPTGSANTGPTGDHTSGRGHYVYLESSPPSKVGEVAQLSSPLLPPAPQQGYCITLWYHMFGATVGSLRLLMKSIQSRSTTLIWQRAGSQESQWERLQHHVTVKDVHQFLLEASVGGEAGDVAVDDISFAQGACPPTDVCDFEEGDCDWQQKTDDDFDWARGSGETPTTGTGPSMDHTTHTATGHYYYLKSHGHAPGHGARMASPLFPAEKGMCLQFWYHMFGHGIGTLNIYQQPSTQRDLSLVFTQTGDQGDLWRFGQVPLQNTPDSSYRIIVEGVTGPSDQGDMAIDDVLVIDTPCPAPGFCDFELSACGWTNALGVDDADWLRGCAETAKSSSGPNVDHTTGSPAGHYLYADTAVGQGGDAAMLFGEIHRPVRGGRCLSFWYHMRGQDTGTLKLFLNNSEHVLWTKSSSGCDDWDEGRVHVDVGVPYWFVFEYKKGHGHGSSGSVALDDIHLTQGSCSPHNDSLSIGIGVGITLLVIVVACAALVFWRKLKSSDEEPFMDCDELNQVSNLHDCDVHVTHISFSRQQPDPSEPPDLSSDV